MDLWQLISKWDNRTSERKGKKAMKEDAVRNDLSVLVGQNLLYFKTTAHDKLHINNRDESNDSHQGDGQGN